MSRLDGNQRFVEAKRSFLTSPPGGPGRKIMEIGVLSSEMLVLETPLFKGVQTAMVEVLRLGCGLFFCSDSSFAVFWKVQKTVFRASPGTRENTMFW